MATAPGPGPLAMVHRLTIWTALLGALAYLVWEGSRLASDWSAAGAVRTALASVAVVVIAGYLRSLRGLAAKLTPKRDRTSGS